MKNIVKASMIALAVAAAGSVLAQSGPDTKTLKECNRNVYACDQRESVTNGPVPVTHRISKVSFKREVFKVASLPVAQTFIYIVKEEKEVKVPAYDQAWFEVTPIDSANWAYVTN